MKFLKISILMVFVLTLISGAGTLSGKDHMKKCSVCKSDIDKGKALKSEFEGKSYYFKSKTCKAAFEKFPQKYTRAYTCQMSVCKHFSNDKNEKCPKCGMKLKTNDHYVKGVCCEDGKGKCCSDKKKKK